MALIALKKLASSCYNSALPESGRGWEGRKVGGYVGGGRISARLKER